MAVMCQMSRGIRNSPTIFRWSATKLHIWEKLPSKESRTDLFDRGADLVCINRHCGDECDLTMSDSFNTLNINIYIQVL